MMVFEQDKKNIENSSSRARERTQIIADILHQCKENKRKSHVMQKANLNFDQVSHYLGDLLGRGLVEQGLSEGGNIYRTTDKGREFLDRYQKLIGFFRGDRNSKQSKSDRASISLVKPIQHRIRSKTLAISFLLIISLGMIISQIMPTLMITTAILSIEQQVAYAQEDNAVGDKLESAWVDTDDKKEIGNVGNAKEKENGDNNSGTGDAPNRIGNDSQLEAEEQEKDGKEGSEITGTTDESVENATLRNPSIEKPKQVVGNRGLPDDDCLFDPSLPKCAPVDGECPDGFAMNEDGQCYLDKPCPKGYERRDNDETGTCYSVSEKHLKVIVHVKGADGAGKVSVEAKAGAGDSRFVDNIQGAHSFKFYKNSMPVGAEFKACAYSDKLDKELCAEGKNGPENGPEKLTIAFSSNIGLKVIVHFTHNDHACVRTVDDSHRAGCKAGHPGDEVVFQFGTGDIEVGEEVYACFQGYDDDCRSVINGPESAPEHIYQLR